MKLNKKIIIKISVLLFSMLIVLAFSSCNSTYWYRYIPSTNDLYAEIRPDYFPQSIWICNDPQINLVVDDNYDVRGEVFIDGEPHVIEVKFVQSVKIMVYLHDNDKITYCLEGTCDFKTDSFSVEIDKDEDTLFYGRYDKIVFYKQ